MMGNQQMSRKSAEDMGILTRLPLPRTRQCPSDKDSHGEGSRHPHSPCGIVEAQQGLDRKRPAHFISQIATVVG